jgi:predicted alpha/beta hydrolase
VFAFASAIPLITSMVGYFPGTRLRFAGREAAQLMRDWAATARHGNYRISPFGDALNQSLRLHSGSVLGLRMSDDGLAPAASMHRLQALTPNARWSEREFARADFNTRRPDHFGWLREPAPVRHAFLEWIHSQNEGRDALEFTRSAL